MADQDARTSAKNALKKAANESVANKVKDLYKKLVEANKAVTNINEQISAAVADHEAELKAIDAAS